MGASNGEQRETKPLGRLTDPLIGVGGEPFTANPALDEPSFLSVHFSPFGDLRWLLARGHINIP